MGRLIDPVVTSGRVLGRCPRCRGDFMGFFQSESLTNTAKSEVELDCQQCGHAGKYFFQWPDEIPKLTLRHVSNGRALGAKNRKARKKKRNPDNVLKGQLAFDLQKETGMIR